MVSGQVTAVEEVPDSIMVEHWTWAGVARFAVFVFWVIKSLVNSNRYSTQIVS